LDRPEQVEVYTILGQLVTRRKLPAGTTRLQLSQRGIYILKSGGMTRRVNL
ncbi:MAG: T9SS type A sorting domain-containing protein, partial [Muribaculaceae bacterium]|nr:T9SS type A sorting domain-containing protein [Muribaculaceae bacterium]